MLSTAGKQYLLVLATFITRVDREAYSKKKESIPMWRKQP